MVEIKDTPCGLCESKVCQAESLSLGEEMLFFNFNIKILSEIFDDLFQGVKDFTKDASNAKVVENYSIPSLHILTEASLTVNPALLMSQDLPPQLCLETPR